MSVDTAVLRQLLATAFNDEELRTFCFDHFRAVYDRFAAGQTRTERIQLLLEHADNRNHLDRLLTAIEQERPDTYAQFAPRLRPTVLDTSSSIPTTQPPTLRTVFGRDAERLRVMDDLGRREAVLLHGLGGIGKTTLAADIARRFRERGDFADGVVWVGDIGTAPLDAICDAIARQLGDEVVPRLAGAAKHAATRALLAAHDLLLVLDDVAVPATGRAFLAHCRPDDQALLLTSRERVLIPDAEDDVSVPPLDRAEAVALFRERARLLAGEDETVGAICQVLGGHPLALTVAAGQVRSGAATLAGLQRRLAQEDRRLSSLRLGPDKQRNVWVSLEASVATLTAGQHLVLDRLAACFGDTTGVELLALACDLSEGACDERVGELVLRSLAERAGERVRLHQLVRDFGREAPGGVLPAVQAGVLAAVQAYAARYGERTPAHHDRLEAEVGNLVGAAEFAAGRRAWDAAFALAGPLVSDSQVFIVRGYWAEQVRLGRVGVRAATETGDQRGRAVLLHNTAAVLQNRGEHGEARRLYEESLAIARRLGDQGGIVTTLHQLGMLAQGAGAPAEARRLYEESLAIDRRLGDQRGIANSLHQLGRLAQDAGAPAEARRLYEESLAIFERLQSPHVETVRRNLAQLDQDDGPRETPRTGRE